MHIAINCIKTQSTMVFRGYLMTLCKSTLGINCTTMHAENHTLFSLIELFSNPDPGMYTVMVAAMDKRVIAVDPILNNLALINQSLKRSNKAQYVPFIRNPIRY